MTTLWYTNKESISDTDYVTLLTLLPHKLQQEIEAYDILDSRKLKLLSKLMIQTYFSTQFDFDWDEIQYSEFGKPHIKNGGHFNISHAENYVVVAFSGADVGIDIELKKEIGFSEIAKDFHQQELEYYKRNESKMESFYNVWTRKEAYLKATGIGLSNGISNENSLEKTIRHMDSDWHIKSLDLFDGYATAICQNQPIGGIELKEFNVNAHLDLNEPRQLNSN